MESFYFFKVDSWSFLKQNFMLKRQIGGRWYLPWVVRLGAHLGREQVCFQGSVENLRTSAICLLPCDQKGLQENPARRSTLLHGWTTGSRSLQWQTPCNVTRGPGGGREGCVLASTVWAFLPVTGNLLCEHLGCAMWKIGAWHRIHLSQNPHPPAQYLLPLRN